MNVSLSKHQAGMIAAEVGSGRFTSASEFIRSLVRDWEQRQIEKDVADLERSHAGAWERDTTPEEEAAILRIQKKVRAEMRAERAAKKKPPGKRA